MAEKIPLLQAVEIVGSGVSEFEGNKKYVKTGNLETGKILTFDQVTYKDRPSRANMQPKSGDVMFAKMKETEKVFLIGSKETDEYLFSTGFMILRPNRDRILPEYLYHYVKCKKFQRKKNSLCHGATQKAINNKDMVYFQMELPSLEEQKKIVDILEKIEGLKEKRKKGDDISSKILEAAFIKLFGNPLSKKSKFKKTKLRGVIDIIVPTRDKPKKFTGTIPWVTLPDLTDSIYIDDSRYKLSVEEAKPTKTRLFPEKTVLLSCAGTLGKIVIAKKEIYSNQQFYGLVCNPEMILPEFLAYQLLIFGESYYKKIGGMSTLTFFSKNVALDIEVILPNIKQQKVFSDLVIKSEEIKQKQSKSKEKIDHVFDALMYKAFNGGLA